MGLEDIKEIKQVTNQNVVNDLINQGNWRLIEAKIEKVKLPAGKEQVGMDSVANWLGGEHWTRYEVIYEEKLVTLYIIGRYE